MAFMAQAPILILTAPDAAPPGIPVVVRTTAAQRKRRCSHRQAGEKNHDSEEWHRNLFHLKPPVALNKIDQRYSLTAERLKRL
jgi:hypothetical protein